jgi:hypothetical protein
MPTLREPSWSNRAMPSAKMFAFLTAFAVFGSVPNGAALANGSTDKCNSLTMVNPIKPRVEGIKPRVEQGAEAQALAYYLRIGSVLGFNLFDKTQSTLDFLIQEYFGYRGLSAADLEVLNSSQLMPKNRAAFKDLAGRVFDPAVFASNLALKDFRQDRVIVSRFFAPKIVDFDKPVDGLFVAGWRKLVRLVPRPGSPADKADLKHGYILFNYVSNDSDPFAARSGDNSIVRFSKNNQVILTPNVFKKCDQDSIYWLVYDSFEKNYEAKLALNAAFDLDGPYDYFVPTSCAQCHGHDAERGGPLQTAEGKQIYPYGKVNFLDTDQWYDSLIFDFPQIATSSNDVLFDGDKDHTSSQYIGAEAIVAKLNRVIQDQNVLAAREDNSFQVRAVQKWLSLHSSRHGPQKLESRILQRQDGVSWDSSNQENMETLRMLSRYCFRCHSSMFYNVFDKGGLLDEATTVPGFQRSILAATDYLPGPDPFMPQGRILEELEKQKLIRFLEGLTR